MITQALLARLEARQGRERDVERFLQGLPALVGKEARTATWFALRFGRGEYGMFAAFPDVNARDSHLAGAAMHALRTQADFLLLRQPRLQRCAVLVDKAPAPAMTEPLAKGLLLHFKARGGHTLEVEHFLRDAKATVMQEARTGAWFGLLLDDGSYGSVGLFPDNGARFLHLTGHLPRELAKHALSLLGSMPDLEMMSVLAARLQVQPLS